VSRFLNSKVALDAHTDQAFAAVSDSAMLSDPMVRATLPVAADLAGLLAAQFPGQEETAARVAMAAASALTTLLQEFRDRGVSEGTIAALLVNTLGFAAVDLHGKAGRE
jgi:hypothetical protein